MGQPDDDKLIKAAAAEASRLFSDRPIMVEATVATWFDLIAVVQLSLRHPNAAASAPCRRAEKFIRDLIENIDPEHGELWRLLSLGFDPAHDQKP